MANTTDTPEPERADQAQAICGELRSKRYFFLDGPPKSGRDLLDGSNDCWCARTMQKIGPDDDLVHPDDCGPQRTCFRPFGPRV